GRFPDREWGKSPIDSTGACRDAAGMPISAPHPECREDERVRAQDPVPRVILTREGEGVMLAELDRLRERMDGEFTERLRGARNLGGSAEEQHKPHMLRC